MISEEIGSFKKERETKDEDLKRISGELYGLNQEYSRQCLEHLELKRPMEEEYERLLKGKTGTWKAITGKTSEGL